MFTLVHITDDQIIKQEELDSSLFEANEIAELRIAAGDTERIEILDETGTKVSVRPRGNSNA